LMRVCFFSVAMSRSPKIDLGGFAQAKNKQGAG